MSYYLIDKGAYFDEYADETSILLFDCPFFYVVFKKNSLAPQLEKVDETALRALMLKNSVPVEENSLVENVFREWGYSIELLRGDRKGPYYFADWYNEYLEACDSEIKTKEMFTAESILKNRKLYERATSVLRKVSQ